MNKIGALFTSGDAAQAAGMSRERLRYFMLRGVIRPTGRTEGGIYLFDPKEVRRFMRLRNRQAPRRQR